MYTQGQTDGYIQGLHRAGTVSAHTQKHADGYIKVLTGQGQFMHTGTN